MLLSSWLRSLAMGRLARAARKLLPDVSAAPLEAACVETLEDRQLLSAANGPVVAAANPVVPNQVFNINENSPLLTAVGNVATFDADGDAITNLQIIGGNTNNAFSIHPTSGLIRVQNPSQLNFEVTQQFNLQIQVTDAANEVGVGVVTININDVNDAPNFPAGQSYNIAENSADGTFIGSLAAGDEDADALTFTIIGSTVPGAVALDAASGNLSVQTSALLDFEANPVITLQVQVTDDGLPSQSTIQNVIINLTNVNEQPLIADQTFSVSENSVVGKIVGNVLATDVDVPTNLTYSILNGTPSNPFAIDAVTGQITVANPAALDFEAIQQFVLTVQVTDDGAPNLSAQATITIDVTNVNEAGTINDATFQIPENSPNGTIVGGVPLATPDPEGDAAVYSIAAGNTGGAFAINPATGQITVANVAALDFETNPVFTLTIQIDDAGVPTVSDTAIITINLIDVNEAPVANPFAVDVTEDSTPNLVANPNGFTGQLTATDPDGDALQFFLNTFPTNGAVIVLPDGRFYYTPFNNYNGPDSFTFVAFDGALFSAPQTVTINVLPVDDAPRINDQAFTIPENSPIGTAVGQIAFNSAPLMPWANNVNEVDGDPVQFGISLGNTGGAFAVNPVTGIITVAGPLNFELIPAYSLTVLAQDQTANQLFDLATITITILNVNEAPQADNLTFSTEEDQVLEAHLQGRDEDGNVPRWALVGQAANGVVTIDSETGFFHYQPNANYFGPDSFTYQTTDGLLLSNVATVNINVIPVNDAPVAPGIAVAINENTPAPTLVTTVAATDPDSPVLAYSIVGGNTNGAFTINPATGAITIANAAAIDFEVNKRFDLDVRVSDGASPALSTTTRVTVFVRNVNDNAPNALGPFRFSIKEESANGIVVGRLAAIDADGSPVQYRFAGGYNGNVGGAFRIDPVTGDIIVANREALNYETISQLTGFPGFDLRIELVDTWTPTVTTVVPVLIDLIDVQETLTVTDRAFLFREEGSVTGRLAAVEQRLDPITFRIIAPTSWGTTVLRPDGTFTYQPRANYWGADFFTYEATDGARTSNRGTVWFTILPQNDAPTVTRQNYTLPENSMNGALVGRFQATDVDGDTLSYAIAAGNPNNAFRIDPQGDIHVNNQSQINYETNPQFVLTVLVTDSGSPAASSIAQAVISLTNLNEAPTLQNTVFQLVENSPAGRLVGTITASDPDAGTPLRYSIVAGNTGNAFLLNPITGQFFVNNPAAIDFETNPVFNLTVQVSDQGSPALTSTANITVQLTNLIEPPVLNDATMSVIEGAAYQTIIGRVTASQTAGTAVQYSIVSGNTNGAFAIHPTTGDIVVANGAAIDYEAASVYRLIVRATAVANPLMKDDGTVTINVIDRAEPPAIQPRTFALAENSPNGTFVGQATATDPERQAIAFSIVGGNVSGAFAVDPATGRITVANSAAVDYEQRTRFDLVVRAADSTGLFSDAAFTVNVTNLNDPAPVGIDVVPGVDNTVRISAGTVEVVVFSSVVGGQVWLNPTTQIDVDSIRFGRVGSEASVKRDFANRPIIRYEDRNGDGVQDLIVTFDVLRTGLSVGVTSGVLRAKTTFGADLEGRGPLTVVS